MTFYPIDGCLIKHRIEKESLEKEFVALEANSKITEIRDHVTVVFYLSYDVLCKEIGLQHSIVSNYLQFSVIESKTQKRNSSLNTLKHSTILEYIPVP